MYGKGEWCYGEQYDGKAGDGTGHLRVNVRAWHTGSPERLSIYAYSYQYVCGGYGADWERNETVVSGFGKALFDHGPKDRTGNPKCDRSFLGTWKRRIVQKAVRIQQQQRAQQADKQRIHRIGSGLCAPGTGICLTNKYYISHPLRHGVRFSLEARFRFTKGSSGTKFKSREASFSLRTGALPEPQPENRTPCRRGCEM